MADASFEIRGAYFGVCRLTLGSRDLFYTVYMAPDINTAGAGLGVEQTGSEASVSATINVVQ